MEYEKLSKVDRKQIYRYTIFRYWDIVRKKQTARPQSHRTIIPKNWSFYTRDEILRDTHRHLKSITILPRAGCCQKVTHTGDGIGFSRRQS